MKLDKIKFASLVGFISCRYAVTLTQDDMKEIDEIIDVEVPEALKVNVAEVDELLRCILTANENGFIPAIKAYRVLTGAGLKESKDAIERYRPRSNNMLDAKTLKQHMRDRLDKPSCIIGEDAKSLVKEFIDSFSEYK